jgi:hypothetical protein
MTVNLAANMGGNYFVSGTMNCLIAYTMYFPHRKQCDHFMEG